MTLKNIAPGSTAKVVLVDLNGDPYEATGGGSGGAITAADGAIVTMGAIADSAYAGSGSATEIALLKAIANSALSTSPTNVTVSTALPAGSALIGQVNVKNVSAVTYETVAASQTAQVLGGSGTTGDFLVGLLVIPATTAPGVVTLLDNATSIPVFVGGTLPSVIPFFIPIGANSASGAWKVTTGANVSVIGIGNFT